MAQTVLSILMDQAVGYTVGLSDKEVEKRVKVMLKGYKKLHLRIDAAKARGKRDLTDQHKQLIEIGKAYTDGAGYMHKEKAERFFAVQAEVAATSEQQDHAAALYDISGLMVGTEAFDGREQGVTDWKGKVVTMDREAELIDLEARRVELEAERIDQAIAAVEKCDPRAALILRCQFIEGWKVPKVIAFLTAGDPELGGSLAESTYHSWRKEALRLFGMAAGLC